MKKSFTALLAATLLLSLAACGVKEPSGTISSSNDKSRDTVTTSSSSSADPADEPQAFSLGDMAVTDKVEFVLTDVSLASALIDDSGRSDYLLPAPEDYDGPVVIPGDGKILVSVSCTIQNIGKIKIGGFDGEGVSRVLPTGGSMFQISSLSTLIDLDYNDGYLFSGDDYAEIGAVADDDGGWLTGDLLSLNLEPLAEKTEYRCCFSVPMEVMENEDFPLNIIVYLPSSDTGTDHNTLPVTYSIR